MRQAAQPQERHASCYAGDDVTGDYAVTRGGALGVGKGRLLRVDRKTRPVLGIVPEGA